MKSLVVDKDYGFVFGAVTGGKRKLIYKGNDVWQCINGDKELTQASKDTSNKVLNYINRPTIIMGSY